MCRFLVLCPLKPLLGHVYPSGPFGPVIDRLSDAEARFCVIAITPCPDHSSRPVLQSQFPNVPRSKSFSIFEIIVRKNRSIKQAVTRQLQNLCTGRYFIWNQPTGPALGPSTKDCHGPRGPLPD